MEIPKSEIIKINDYIFNHKNEFTKEFGEEVKRIREEKNMTAEELAERALTTVNYIRQIESGDYGVSLSKLIVICNALEINPGVLVSNFIVCDLNDDSFYEELQDSKNLSENIIRYMKNKKVI